MAGSKGINLKIKKGAAVICSGITSKSITYGGEPIDISSDDDDGYRRILSEPGMKSVDIGFEGVVKDSVLRAIMLSGDQMLTDVSVEFPNGDTLTCDFFMANLEENGETNDAIKFSCELQSSGPWVFTPAV